MNKEISPGGTTPPSRVKPLSNRPASRRERKLLADTQAAKQRLATVLESISDGFIALDRNWAYTALNNQACESMGISRSETLGRRIWDVYSDTLGTPFEAQLRRAVDSLQQLEKRNALSKYDRKSLEELQVALEKYAKE